MGFTSGQILTASQLNIFTPGTKIKNANGSASAPTYTFDGDANTGMFRSGTDALGFSTGGTQVVTISSDGRLGVGDTSPSATLHVNAATAKRSGPINSPSNQRSSSGIRRIQERTCCNHTSITAETPRPGNGVAPRDRKPLLQKAPRPKYCRR